MTIHDEPLDPTEQAQGRLIATASMILDESQRPLDSTRITRLRDALGSALSVLDTIPVS